MKINLCYSNAIVCLRFNIINFSQSAVVHTLIKSYKLLEKCTVSPITPASEEDLLSFHSASYVDYLKKAQECSDLEKVTESDEPSDFNLEYDCPLFENIYDFAAIIAGGTLTAVRLICPDEVGIWIFFGTRNRLLGRLSLTMARSFNFTPVSLPTYLLTYTYLIFRSRKKTLVSHKMQNPRAT